MKKKSVLIPLISILIFGIYRCTKEDPISVEEIEDNQGVSAKYLPVIRDTYVEIWTPVSVMAGFNVTDDGGGPILVHGVCWSTSKYPTTNDFSSKGLGAFSKDGQYFINNLMADTQYYLRAFAANELGTAYGEQVIFTMPDFKNQDLPYGQVSDIDGNNYRTIQIGPQVWMADNLKTTRYNDGEQIRLGTGAPAGYTDWFDLGVGSYCWFDNDFSKYGDYGALYNWHAVNTGKLCPEGWHVPSLTEWNLMVEWLGGKIGPLNGSAESLLITWGSTHINIFASGFAPVELGCLYGFGFISFPPFWWTASAGGPGGLNYVPWAYIFSFDIEAFEPASYGFSVRCLRN